jgi:hypothetical protein
MDTDPSLARVVFDLPRRDVPLLLAHLGSYALEHNLDIRISNAPAEASLPSLYVESPNYNPDFVVLLPASEGEGMTPVVTKQLLENFLRARGNVGLAERLIGRLGFAASSNKGLREMLYSKAEGSQFSAIGIRVDRIQELYYLLDTGDLDVDAIGRKSIDTLGEYCKVLFPEDTTQS